MNNNQILYIIANTKEPYGGELANILGYPNGFIYRARFKEEWIEQAVIQSYATLNDTICLIIYRDYETAILYPIRFGKITKVMRHGEIYHFEYLLNDIIEYDNNSEARENQISEFQENFKHSQPEANRTNISNNDMTSLVLLSSHIPQIKNSKTVPNQTDRSFESWSNILNLIKNIRYYDNAQFLRIIELCKVGMKEEIITPNDSKYTLIQDQIYELRVAQRIPNQTSNRMNPNDVLLNCHDKMVKILNRQRRAVGKYDILPYRFQTPNVTKRRISFLELSGNMKNREKIELDIRIDIESGLFYPVIRFIGSVGAVILAVLPTYFQLQIPLALLLFVISWAGYPSFLEVLKDKSIDLESK